MNIHRWRKLEGSDPDTYELVQKIQSLQRRLIAKTEEAVNKETQIQELEKKYADLKVGKKKKRRRRRRRKKERRKK